MGRKMGSTASSVTSWYRFFSDLMASLLRYTIGMVELVSDVSCRYSLGTNPRGVKDYSLVIIGLRLFPSSSYPCMHYTVHALYPCMHYTPACIIVNLHDSS
jgi:hypothetical protein